MKTIVVTPTYNERDSVGALISRLRGLPEAPDVLVVDDGSPDGTAQLVRELSEVDPAVHLLSRPGKAGLASAYVAGFRAALAMGAERVVQMDADLSHDPDDVPRLLASGADLALGSRYVAGGGTRNWPVHRRAVSRFGSIYARQWLSLPQRDLTGGFKAWRRAALESALEAPVRSEGYTFQVEMTLRAVRAGFWVEELPIVFTERAVGSSKMSARVALEAAWLVPALRFR